SRYHCTCCARSYTTQCRHAHRFWHCDLVQVCKRRINGTEVLLHNYISTLAIGFLNALLNLLNSLFARQDTTYSKEAGLHDRIDAPTHANARGNLVGIDDIEM